LECNIRRGRSDGKLIAFILFGAAQDRAAAAGVAGPLPQQRHSTKFQ
jgi:hypothetical protein